jgi:hypothetical protein
MRRPDHYKTDEADVYRFPWPDADLSCRALAAFFLSGSLLTSRIR